MSNSITKVMLFQNRSTTHQAARFRKLRSLWKNNAYSENTKIERTDIGVFMKQNYWSRSWLESIADWPFPNGTKKYNTPKKRSSPGRVFQYRRRTPEARPVAMRSSNTRCDSNLCYLVKCDEEIDRKKLLVRWDYQNNAFSKSIEQTSYYHV